MTYTTQFGDTPTHLWPDSETMKAAKDEGHSYLLFFLEEGQSVPRPGSTKHLWSGPGVYIAPTEPRSVTQYEFDVPPPRFREERCGWLSTPRLGQTFDLGPYEDGRTLADITKVVEPRPND